MKAFVIGCGRWGSFIAWYLNTISLKVELYGRASSENMKQLIENRKNDYIEIPQEITLTTSLKSIYDTDLVVISVGAQQLRSVCTELQSLALKNKIIILCMKGLEISTGKRLSVIAEEIMDSSNKIAVWLGPGHVQEFYRGIPNCMVIDSQHPDVKTNLVEILSSPRIRFYLGTDIIGNEIGAAAKNVIGIAAGFLDGMGLSSLKGALMSRGAREISRLIKACGGDEITAYGLCHLGDYEATVFSQHSHNRRYGEAFIKGIKFEKLAEGCYTVKALLLLAKQHSVDLPICQTVNDVIYNGADPETAFQELFTRDVKCEF